MKWNQEVSPKGRRWFIIGVAFVLALLWVACQAGHPAGAAVQTGTPFTMQGTQMTDAQAAKVIGSVGANKPGTCWGWNNDWPVKDAIGKKMYDPGIRVQWCTNAARTKVTALILWQCFDGGGYYDYDGCTKSKGSVGYPSLGLSANWKYHWALGLPGVTDTRTPSIVFSVYADGGVAGTIYFDN
jgi:hypothetical protein